MPIVRLSRFEVRKNLLPPVCVVCGAPAVVRRDRKFSWFPSWTWVIVLVSWLIGLILMVALTKTMRVRLPACAEHEGYWRRRGTFLAIGWVLTLSICAVLIVFLGLQPEQRQRALAVPPCGTSATTFVTWIVMLIVVCNRGVRAIQISERSITLAGVHERFDSALEADRDRDRAESDADERELRAFLRERRERRRSANAAVPLAELAYDELEERAGDLIKEGDPPTERPTG